jgi:hypothetical protein
MNIAERRANPEGPWNAKAETLWGAKLATRVKTKATVLMVDEWMFNVQYSYE